MTSAVRYTEQDTPVRIQKANGFALIDMIFVCGMIGLISSIAVPRLLMARQSAGAASAVGTLRAINSSELSYAITCGNGFYSPNLTTLGVVPAGSTEAFISPDLSAANTVSKSGYTITLTAQPFVGAPPTCNGLGADLTGRGYVAAADPQDPTNVRFFATNSVNVIWEDVSSLAATIPEAGDPPSGHPLQ